MRTKSAFAILWVVSVFLFACSTTAKEKKEQLRIVATFTDFTDEFWYSIPIEFDGADGYADAICPMAEFTILEPKKEEGNKVRIIFFGDEESKSRTVSNLRRTKEKKETYHFYIPSNSFKDGYYYIESSFITGFKKQS